MFSPVIVERDCVESLMQFQRRILESNPDPVERGTYPADDDSLGHCAGNDKPPDQHPVVGEHLRSGRDVEQVPGRSQIQPKDCPVTGYATHRSRSIEVMFLALEQLTRMASGGGAVEKVGGHLPCGIDLIDAPRLREPAILRGAVDVSIRYSQLVERARFHCCPQSGRRCSGHPRE